ncbi:hypothetical protein GW952_03210 [Klebsiella michiganensis]|uniref:Uncharacterized protein n=1 Tax=Klebsiella michiganensis TaxID=1134687 RepID=A0A6P1USR3_9ENTR|nr:hypothetical protein [Klebsiella michiganensis]QHS44687.1 hypothetical protein GW952_03210 [Klebsiella michiganensis]
MKNEVVCRSERLSKYNNIRFTITFYVVVSFTVLSGIYWERFFDVPYKYLFVSPSFYNYAYLNWIGSVWGSILGIHGTIAALSITFMSMFVGQVSTSSEYGFESISKELLLRKHNFLSFSIHSVCSLLCGVFLLLVGSGLLGYMISTFLSLHFIIQYGVMYYKLYNLTEKPEIIKSFLFDAIEDVGHKYDNINEQGLAIENAFRTIIFKHEFYSTDRSGVYWDEKAIILNVFPNQSAKIVSGFDSEFLSKLSDKIISMKYNTPPKLYFLFSFLSPLSSASIKITPSSGEGLLESDISEITSLLKKCFVYSSVPSVYNEFKKFEEALVNNVRNSLLFNDEWSLSFGVKAFNKLTSSDNYILTLKNIDLSITSSSKKDIVEISVLASFLDKMTAEALNQRDINKAADILRSLMDLAQYIYSKENYNKFYEVIFHHFEYMVKYQAEESNYAYVDLYISLVIRHFVYGNHAAFKIDTNFITTKLRYLDLYNQNENDCLNELQRKMLRCLFEIITLLIMRIEYVDKNKKDNEDELGNLRFLLKSWVNAEFLEELYFKKELYDLLFTIPNDYSVFDAQNKLREIPEGEATWRSISSDTYKMIALMLTQSSFNNNNLNVVFIRDDNDFYEVTKLSTHKIKDVINYLKGDGFLDLINVVSEGEDIINNRAQIISKLESILSSMNASILNEVIASELAPELVGKYIQEVRLSVEKLIGLVIPLDNLEITKELLGVEANLLVYKREVIPSVDNSAYMMDSHNHSNWLAYYWVRENIDSIRDNPHDIVGIDSLQDLKTDKLITIEYKVESGLNVYKYTKGLKVNDKEGYLGLNGSGMYYIDLLDNFEFKREADILSISIGKIDEDNLRKAKELLGDGDENPLLYAMMSVLFKILANPKGIFKLYYLSEDKCRFLNQKEEREMEQLLKASRVDSIDNSSMS